MESINTSISKPWNECENVFESEMTELDKIHFKYLVQKRFSEKYIEFFKEFPELNDRIAHVESLSDIIMNEFTEEFVKLPIPDELYDNDEIMKKLIINSFNIIHNDFVEIGKLLQKIDGYDWIK